MADDIERAFLAFHEANPEVYATLARLAREAVAAGRTRIGMKMLWEVMRWEMYITTKDGESEFKLCNNYHALYARVLMMQEPDLAGLFEIRGHRPTPVVDPQPTRRRIVRTPKQREVGELPRASRGNMQPKHGAEDVTVRQKRTRGASSMGTGRTAEERQRALERNRARRAAANSA